MKELKHDLFNLISDPLINAICITTNGQYTKDGRAAMGGGCAGECARRWPETAVRLGKCLKNFATNVPFVIGAVDANGKYIEPTMKIIKDEKFKCLILSFPTIHNIMDGADLELIKQSAAELIVLVNRFQLRGIAIPRMGVGIGGLKWSDVKTVVEPMLDDRFTVVSFDHEE
jgi:O-acetyl-ADP-ribose deacetylase (regulator of RNase III)